MRFEVPQFIEVEDKIFGPFTWKQFVYLAGGGGAALILFVTVPLILFALLGIPIMALSGFLAFHQINNRPFSIFLESCLQYFSKNKLYLWKRETKQTILGEAREATISENSVIQPPAKENLRQLAHKLELNTLEK